VLRQINLHVKKIYKLYNRSKRFVRRWPCSSRSYGIADRDSHSLHSNAVSQPHIHTQKDNTSKTKSLGIQIITLSLAANIHTKQPKCHCSSHSYRNNPNAIARMSAYPSPAPHVPIISRSVLAPDTGMQR